MGYKPSIISTTVDSSVTHLSHTPGYKPSIISTTVDHPNQASEQENGYKPSIISTTVDIFQTYTQNKKTHFQVSYAKSVFSL